MTFILDLKIHFLVFYLFLKIMEVVNLLLLFL